MARKDFKSAFIPNHPFHIHVRVTFGNIAFINVYQVNLGKGIYHQWKLQNGVYMNWGEKVTFESISNTASSIGCADYETFFLSATEKEFEEKIQTLTQAILTRAVNKLTQELDKIQLGIENLSKHLEVSK